MHTPNFLLLFGILSLVIGCGPSSAPSETVSDATHTSMDYPTTRTDGTTDTLWGVEVADPYRWLEDDRSPETEAWVTAQNQVTRTYLEGLPLRAALADEFRSLYNYEKMGMPRKVGGHYYLARNSGLKTKPFTTDAPPCTARTACISTPTPGATTAPSPAPWQAHRKTSGTLR